MSRILNLRSFVVLGILFALATVAPNCASAQGKGHGGHGGHSGHGGHGGHGGNGGYGGHGGYNDHNHSQNFFGFGPGGFTYGYSNENFGLLIGPVGGYQSQPYYSEPYYAAPAYDQVIVGPPSGYNDPGLNGYGGYSQPVISAPIAPPSNPSVAAPALRELSYSGTPGSPAESFYRQSVEAFQGGEYDRATRLVDHAIVEDSASGFLRIYAAQCLLATGEFQASAAALNDGLQKVAPSEWGKEVKNFSSLYKRNDYVTHVKQLEEFAAENPQVAFGNALCAYHFHFLGHADAAQKHLDAARKADANDPLVKLLSSAIEPEPAETLPAPLSILVPSK